MIRNLHELVECYLSLKEKNNALVMATLVETEGSTYRKPGARILIDESLNQYSILAMGINDSILEQAREIFSIQSSKLVTVDLRNESRTEWEAGQDSNGMLSIFFEYISVEDDNSILQRLAYFIKENQTAALITVTESANEDLAIGTSLLISSGKADEILLNESTTEYVVDEASDVINTGKPRYQAFLTAENSFHAFIDLLEAPFHLLIFGAGSDVGSLVKLARFTGWQVSISDPSEACNRENFPEANYCHVINPETVTDLLDQYHYDAVVLMTHSFDNDLIYLRNLAHTKTPYIGLLGPEAKRDKLLEQLANEKSELSHRLYGPTGLDIGAELPEEIALSIISEIQAVRTNSSGGISSTEMKKMHSNAGTHENLYALILAAGGATRFGGVKQLVELEGKSLLRRAIENTQYIFDNRLKIVLGNRANKIQREVDSVGGETIHNKNWKNGISSSLRAGVDALPKDCTGVMIVFCDQALITHEHLMGLIELWNKDQSKIIASTYADTTGVPAIFPNKYFSEILSLRGDNGAKSIIEKYSSEVSTVDLPEAECDIDTQTDLLNLLGKTE
jgi:xanthine/CO dehydrogenase XdhC/CoxF family maturation factor/CTP:molybdopterin cytidylyltransferase MocA